MIWTERLVSRQPKLPFRVPYRVFFSNSTQGSLGHEQGILEKERPTLDSERRNFKLFGLIY